MRSPANCKVSILRGSETNVFDDEVDSEAAVRTGIQALIKEQSRRTYLPAEGATRIIRSYTGRVGPEVDIRKGDRLRREDNGAVYLVVDIAEPSSPAMQPDQLLELSRTT